MLICQSKANMTSYLMAIVALFATIHEIFAVDALSSRVEWTNVKCNICYSPYATFNLTAIAAYAPSATIFEIFTAEMDMT